LIELVKANKLTVPGIHSKILSRISKKNIQDEIMDAVKSLAGNPFPYGEKPFKKLDPPVIFYQFTAQYRIRVRDYRILYDVDKDRKIVWVLALRIRSEKTYK